MKVLVTNISLATKTAQVTIGDKSYVTRISIPTNKGAENQVWVNIEPFHPKLGEGEHKKWLTVEKTTVQAELETLKKEKQDNFLTIHNLIKYCTKEEYEQVLAIWLKAEKELKIQRLERMLVETKEGKK